MCLCYPGEQASWIPIAVLCERYAKEESFRRNADRVLYGDPDVTSHDVRLSFARVASHQALHDTSNSSFFSDDAHRQHIQYKKYTSNVIPAECRMSQAFAADL